MSFHSSKIASLWTDASELLSRSQKEHDTSLLDENRALIEQIVILHESDRAQAHDWLDAKEGNYVGGGQELHSHNEVDAYYDGKLEECYEGIRIAERTREKVERWLETQQRIERLHRAFVREHDNTHKTITEIRRVAEQVQRGEGGLSRMERLIDRLASQVPALREALQDAKDDHGCGRPNWETFVAMSETELDHMRNWFSEWSNLDTYYRFQHERPEVNDEVTCFRDRERFFGFVRMMREDDPEAGRMRLWKVTGKFDRADDDDAVVIVGLAEEIFL